MAERNDREYREGEFQVANSNKNELILEGYAIVWDTPTLIGTLDDGFYESIDAAALDKTDMKDVFLRYNHDEKSLILARVRNKSLILTVDNHGLKVEAHLQTNIQSHVEVYNAVKSGLLSSMSFAFVVGEQEITRRDGKIHRVVKSIKKLLEVSIVDDPAYNETEIYARSAKLLESEVAALERAERDRVEIEKIKLRIRGIL